VEVVAMLRSFDDNLDISRIYGSFTADSNIWHDSDKMMVDFLNRLDTASGTIDVFITTSLQYLIFKSKNKSSDIARISAWNGKYTIEVPKNDELFDKGVSEVPHNYEFVFKESTDNVDHAVDTIMSLIDEAG
jgi:hypothetical protein